MAQNPKSYINLKCIAEAYRYDDNNDYTIYIFCNDAVEVWQYPRCTFKLQEKFKSRNVKLWKKRSQYISLGELRVGKMIKIDGDLFKVSSVNNNFGKKKNPYCEGKADWLLMPGRDY